MTRFAKEIRKLGLQLENDYLWTPYEIAKNIFLDSTKVDEENATVKRFLNIGTEIYRMNRNGQLDFDFE